MAANNGFNGSFVTWPSTTAPLAPLTSISFSDTVAEVQVSGSTDTTHRFVAGIPDQTMTVELVGASSALTVGTTGQLNFHFNTWASTEEHTFPSTALIGSASVEAIITNVDQGGSVDSAITNSVTVRPRCFSA